MGNSRENDPDALWDEGLRAAFQPASVIDAIERLCGTRPSVLLRDFPGDDTPVLAASTPDGGDAIRDDSRYQVHGEIARGGVGVVYKGHDRDLGRDVALKVLRPDHAGNPDLIERFVEEAQVGGQLQHPGVVPVYGLEVQPDGRPYFAMKLVKGRTLSALLEEREDPARDRRRLLGIFEQVCRTMAYAHARGVIHRDIKPANVMIGAFGEVHVVDWGFAKVGGKEDQASRKAPDASVITTVRSEEDSHSVEGSVFGTPAYMPPEQAQGRVDDLDERTDVFALGAVLTEILTGEPPYVGELGEVLAMAARARLEDAWRRLDECGADTELVVLAKQFLLPVQEERPRDAGVVAEEVAGYLAEVEERAHRAESEAAEARAVVEEERARRAAESRRAEKAKALEAKASIATQRERELQKAEQRRVRYELRARVRTRAAAAALVLAILVGGGAWAWSAGSGAVRSSRAEVAVENALRRASSLESDGNLAEAVASAREAVALAGEAGDDAEERASAVLQRLESRKRASDAAAALTAKDEEILRRLEDVRGVYGEGLDKERLDADFAAAFRAYGLDPEKDPDGAKARIRGRPAAVTAALGDALDEWAWIRSMRPGMEKGRWLALLAVSRVVDPDPVRNRIRDVLEGGDPSSLLGLLREADADRLPPRTALLLCRIDPWQHLPRRSAAKDKVGLLESAWRRRPDDATVCNQLAWALLLRRTEFLPYGVAALALHPESAWRQGATAWLLHRSPGSDPEEVLARVDRAMAGGIGGGDLLMVRSRILLGKGDREAALREARRAVKDYREQFTSWQALGKVLFDLEEYREAGEAWEKARSLGAGVSVLHNIAQAWDRLGDSDRARKTLEEAIALEPELRVAQGFLGYILAKRGDLAGASRHLREAVRLDPDDCRSWLNLGICLSQLGDLEGASAALGTVVRRNPFALARANKLSQALILRGEYDLAIRHLERVLVARPRFAPAWCNLGAAHFGKGNSEERLRCCRKAASLAPKNPINLLNLAFELRERGEFEQALVSFRRCMAVFEAPKLAGSPLRSVCERELGQCERLLALAGSLDGILDGTRKPADARETLDFAALCRYSGRGLAAARFHEVAFTREPALLEEPEGSDRLEEAAEDAIAVGFGGQEGNDPSAMARWRGRALGWLREVLARRTKELPGANPAARIELRNRLWQLQRRFLRHGVRDEGCLAMLPTTEAEAWRRLFAGVKRLIDQSLEIEYRFEEDSR